MAEDVKKDDRKTDEVKCDNHPDRDATEFTGDNAFKIRLCEECTPPWFKTDN